MLGLLRAALEEVGELVRGLRSVVGVNLEAGNPFLDDLARPALARGERGQAARHRLDHRQPEGLVQRGLDEGAAGVGDVTVQLAWKQVPMGLTKLSNTPETEA